MDEQPLQSAHWLTEIVNDWFYSAMTVFYGVLQVAKSIYMIFKAPSIEIFDKNSPVPLDNRSHKVHQKHCPHDASHMVWFLNQRVHCLCAAHRFISRRSSVSNRLLLAVQAHNDGLNASAGHCSELLCVSTALNITGARPAVVVHPISKSEWEKVNFCLWMCQQRMTPLEPRGLL